MNNRHSKIGMKQVIRLEWMDKVLSMLLAGMSELEIRKHLDEYLSTQKQSGGEGERGKKTYGIAVGILSCWFAPDKDLIDFRNDVLKLARNLPRDKWLPLHWSIISASYPFWFNIAKQVGRLLNLQDKVTQRQIFDRIKEQYGDRETIARNARYAVRSLIAWGVLRDSENKGCYEKASPISISDINLAWLILESALYSIPEGKGTLAFLINDPSFFPFHFPAITTNSALCKSDRIELIRLGLDNDLLKLKM